MFMTVFMGMTVCGTALMRMDMFVSVGMAGTAGGACKRGGHLAARGAVDVDFSRQTASAFFTHIYETSMEVNSSSRPRRSVKLG